MKKLPLLKRVPLLATVFALLCGTVFTACSSSAAPQNVHTEEVTASMPAARGSGGTNADASAPEDTYKAPTAGEAETADAQPLGGSGITPPSDGRKVVINGSVTMETLTFDKSCAALQATATELGGYVSFAYVEGEPGHHRSAQYTVRIPVEHYVSYMNKLPQSGNILQRSENSEDVTALYVDIEARLKALRTQEGRLLDLMEKASTLKDVLALQEQITELQYEIESYEARKRTYDNLVSYSSLDITLREVREATPPEPETYASRAAATFRRTMRSTGAFFQDLGLGLIAALPALLFLAVVITVVLLVLRQRKRRRKSAEQTSALQAQIPPSDATSAQSNSRAKEEAPPTKEK